MSRVTREHRRAAITRTVVVVAAMASLMTGVGTGTALAAPQLRTGFADIDRYQLSDQAGRLASFANTVRARGSVVRLAFVWSDVAVSRPPSRAAARDPFWAGYKWDDVDDVIRDATSQGLDPLVVIAGGAPVWAEGNRRPPVGDNSPAGSWKPSAKAYEDFAQAFAHRFSGNTPDPANPGSQLPRVRYWQAWNEPNLTDYLTPQWKRRGGKYLPASPGIYRRLLNGFYRGVKRAVSSNFVVAAGTAPYGDYRPGGRRIPPARFTRELLCVKGSAKPRAKRCGKTTWFNALAHHPYAVGSPTRRARNPDDVAIPDMAKLTRPLDVALKARTVRPRGPKQLWITEISWDSNPPDPNGLPVARQALYLQSTFYILWRQGVDVITWWQQTDAAKGHGWEYTLQSGVLYRGATAAEDQPKPSYTAFRFPFTAYRTGASNTVALWGLAPRASATVAIERKRGNRWTRLTSLKARGGRVFFRQRRVPLGTVLRARHGKETSRSWTVRRR